MNDKFFEATLAIKRIEKGTADIVSRMSGVSAASKDSYKNMTELENILEQFKTKEEVNQVIEEPAQTTEPEAEPTPAAEPEVIAEAKSEPEEIDTIEEITTD